MHQVPDGSKSFWPLEETGKNFSFRVGYLFISPGRLDPSEQWLDSPSLPDSPMPSCLGLAQVTATQRSCSTAV